MGVLSFVRNKRAVLKIANRRGEKWPSNLPAPIYAADNEALMRAVSLVRGWDTKDGEPVFASDLTPGQARDIVAWCRV